MVVFDAFYLINKYQVTHFSLRLKPHNLKVKLKGKEENAEREMCEKQKLKVKELMKI